jgi:hypothetical protein
MAMGSDPVYPDGGPQAARAQDVTWGFSLPDTARLKIPGRGEAVVPVLAVPTLTST